MSRRIENKTFRKSKVIFITDGRGFVELMKSPEITEEITRLAKERADNLEEGNKTYKVTNATSDTRNVARIYPDSPEAYYSNLKHNDVLKAL